MAQEGKTPYAVFVSFRFAEALAEANALQRELNARGYRTFVSNETPGADLQEAIATALGESKLQVLLATPTYGKKTNEFYSTYQEMNYALDTNDGGNPFLITTRRGPQHHRHGTSPCCRSRCTFSHALVSAQNGQKAIDNVCVLGDMSKKAEIEAVLRDAHYIG